MSCSMSMGLLDLLKRLELLLSQGTFLGSELLLCEAPTTEAIDAVSKGEG